MASKRNKHADNEKINEEEKEILNSMKQNLGTFAQLLEEEQTGGKKVMSLKERQKKEIEDKKLRNAQVWIFR